MLGDAQLEGEGAEEREGSDEGDTEGSMVAEAVLALLREGAGEPLPLRLAAAEALAAPKMLAVSGCDGAADGDAESDALG